jgi:hypothetical protein
MFPCLKDLYAAIESKAIRILRSRHIPVGLYQATHTATIQDSRTLLEAEFSNRRQVLRMPCFNLPRLMAPVDTMA